MDQDQIPHLETFVKAAELGSFTAAAKALHLTQAAISQRIQAIEQRLDVPLFLRRGGRVQVTEAGQRLHEYAERILALHREAFAEIAGRVAPLTGELTLAASSIPGEHLLPELLARFHAHHPHIQVRATVTDTEDVLGQVEQGQAEVGLVGGKGDSTSLAYREFAQDELVLIVPRTHDWGTRTSVSGGECLSQPIILREPGSGSRRFFEQALAAAGHSSSDLRIVLELGSNEAIKEAVRRGLGLAVLSTHSVEKEVATGELRVLRITGLVLRRPMYLVWDQRRALPIPARQFLDVAIPEANGKG